jgi:transposase
MILSRDKRMFVRLGFTDMRKQINGLTALIQDLRPESPFDGSYYLFCGKTRRVIKLVYWDTNGFCMWQKRLERDFFPWPRAGDELNEMTRQHIRLLLRGIDVWKEHKRIDYAIAG